MNIDSYVSHGERLNIAMLRHNIQSSIDRQEAKDFFI